MPAHEADRNQGLDALRAALTLLVVFHHAAITYGAIGGWYYREIPPDRSVQSALLIFFCTVNQAFFMGLFFLISGYLTPGQVSRRGPWTYLRERLIRLGLPLVAYALVIGPLTIALAQTAKGRPFLETLERLWMRGQFENGPLWFAQALLIFAVGYLLWRAFTYGFERGTARQRHRDFPSNRSFAVAALATGAAAFALRLSSPIGTQAFGLQLGYFASYVLLFVVGCVGSSNNWRTEAPEAQRRLWVRVSLCALPILPIVVLSAPSNPAFRGDTSGGWNLQAVLYAFWEPLVAWGFILALLHGFGKRFSRLNGMWAALSRRAYAIFVIHPPILVGVALIWRDVSASPLVKFAVTGSVASWLCFWIAGLLLRLPVLKRIL